MEKVNVNIELIKESLINIGYVIDECIEKENNGKMWQIKFSNSGAIANVYDTNNKNNTVVNGKPEDNEREFLKSLIDKIKSQDIVVDSLNRIIVDLINLKKEDYYYDYKEMKGDNQSLLHDILCLSNNVENVDSYLIYGVADDCKVVGVNNQINSNDIYDFLKTLKFAGDHFPEVEVKHLYYKYKKIDVIVCKKSKYVPFYLIEKYRGVYDHQIYTRTGDTNTPLNRHANYLDTEKLWKIHFD